MSTAARHPVTTLLRGTVTVVDMVGYSDIARMLEENMGPSAVTELNRQIQDFIQRSLAKLSDPQAFRSVAKTGDGGILLFDRADDAHIFAASIHCLADEHNNGKTEITALRRFRTGLATGDVNVTACDGFAPEYAGITIANAVRLEGASKAGHILVDTATFRLLSPELQALYGPQETVKGKRAEEFRAHRLQVTDCGESSSLLSRRMFLGLGLPVLSIGVLAEVFGHSRLDRWLSQLTQPLPDKKFVALLRWPADAGAAMNSTIDGVVAAIESELTRAEAQNPSFYITTHHVSAGVKTFAEVRDAVDSLGVNLLLAISAAGSKSNPMLKLSIIEPQGQRTLRQALVSNSTSEQLTIGDKATHAAAELLALTDSEHSASRSMAGTSSAAAYAAFQSAEVLVSQPNHSGLDSAIEKYRQALELDPRYAKASAKLACAYCWYYQIHSAASALALADWNSRAAVEWAPDLADAHFARSWVLDNQGDKSGCQREIDKSLSLDPTNSRFYLFQAQFYTRCNRWADAEAAFTKLLKLRPNYPLAHSELGILFYSQGNYSGALNQFRAYALMRPKEAQAFNNVGAVYVVMGMTDEAAENLKKSLALDPTGYALSTMAQFLRYEGHYKEAVSYAQKATNSNPDSSHNWLELGDCYAGAPGETSKARAAYKKSLLLKAAELQSDPTDGAGWMVLALLRAKTDDQAAASVCLQKAAQYSADDMDSQLYKLRALTLMGKRDEALQMMNRFAERGATMFQLRGEQDLRALIGNAHVQTPLSPQVVS